MVHHIPYKVLKGFVFGYRSEGWDDPIGEVLEGLSPNRDELRTISTLSGPEFRGKYRFFLHDWISFCFFTLELLFIQHFFGVSFV